MANSGNNKPKVPEVYLTPRYVTEEDNQPVNLAKYYVYQCQRCGVMTVGYFDENGTHILECGCCWGHTFALIKLPEEYLYEIGNDQ